jgi:hypothetical protein
MTGASYCVQDQFGVRVRFDSSAGELLECCNYYDDCSSGDSCTASYNFSRSGTLWSAGTGSAAVCNPPPVDSGPPGGGTLPVNDSDPADTMRDFIQRV